MTDNDVWIYLSYAHDDDAPTSASDDERGFVTSLHRMLELKLRDLGARQTRIWRDVLRANSGDQFDVANDGLRKADLMLVVMSRNWMERPYCRRELEAFISFRKKAGVSNVAERVIVVGKGYVDRLTLPAELQNQVGFLFYGRDDTTDPDAVTSFFNRGKIVNDRYYDVRDQLARILLKRSDRIVEEFASGSASPAHEPIVAPNGRIVYLAKPASDMKAAYDRVANELQGKGFGVVPRVAADVPGDTTALAFVGDALAKAEASIHLVGQMPGFAPEGLDQIVKLQLAKARERAEETEDRAGRPFRRFVWAPKVLELSVPAAERNPEQVLARFDQRIPTDRIHDGALSKFVEMLFDALADRTVPPPAPEPTRPHRVESKEASPQARYYVSYAWADLSDPDRDRDVDRLCDEARKRGVEVIRDKTSLGHGDLISDFMRQIGKGDRVFIFLSDKYLKSPYCMMELFEMWRNARQNRSEFLRRVRFITIDGAKIGRPDEWLEYAKYWKRERELLRQKIDDVGWEDAGQEAQIRYDNMKTFAGKVSDVLALFADTVQPRTFEDFVKYGFDGPGERAARS